MANLNHQEVAKELIEVKKRGGEAKRPSARQENFSMEDAYSVGEEIARIYASEGHTPVGRKIGFTNKALWERLGLDSVIWSYVYDNTLFHARDNKISFSLKNTAAPKIEPEIVFKLKSTLKGDETDPARILEAIEWIAFGYEIVDCNYPNWHFRPADMVADFGFHTGLVVGKQQNPADFKSLAEKLREVKVRLLKNGEVAAEGTGRNVMDSPALSLGSVAGIISRQPGGPLKAGEIITTGTLVDAQFVKPGETWTVELEGLELTPVSITFTE